MNQEQANTLDQLDGDENAPETTEEVTPEVTEDAQTSANIEPSTLQVDTPEEKQEEQFVPPQALTAPPIPPQPVHVAPQAVPEAVNKELSEPDFRIIANKRREDTKKRLDLQQKVWFMIPITPGESQGLSYETVTIDGLRMEIKKGVMVELPRQVAEILSEKYRVELNAGRDKRIDGNQEKLNALS